MSEELLFNIILDILMKAEIKQSSWEKIKNLIDTRYKYENLNCTIKEVQ